ncbi:MAG: tetratricopeptide repeat protein, partial [Planctomycetota bacterium]
MAFNPRKFDAILQQAAALYENGQSGQARQLAADVLKKDPRNIGGLRIFALASTNSMQWPEAVKAAEKAAKLAPRDAGSLTTLATVLIAGGRFAEAMSKARTARKIAPNDPRTQGTYLECLIWTGEFETCRELLQEQANARRLAPGTAASYVGACFETGHYDDAIDAANAFLEDHEKGQPALVVRPLLSLLGRSLEKAARYPEAVDAYERMNAVVPGMFDVAEADRLVPTLPEVRSVVQRSKSPRWIKRGIDRVIRPSRPDRRPPGAAASISYPARMAFNPRKLDAILQQAAALYEN